VDAHTLAEQDDDDVIFTQAGLSSVTTVGDLAELVRSRAG